MTKQDSFILKILVGLGFILIGVGIIYPTKKPLRKFNSNWGWNQLYQSSANDELIQFQEINHQLPLRHTLIAVIDTGIDLEPGMANLWKDEKGNIGHNFVAKFSPQDFMGHGTAVADIIAGPVTSHTGGIDPQAQIMVLKYINGKEDFNNSLNEAKAIEYAVNHHAQIINLSLSGREPSLVEFTALLKARKADIPVIVSAGNDDENLDIYKHYPCAYGLDNIICVGNQDVRGKLQGSSNYSKTLVPLTAPGEGIMVPHLKFLGGGYHYVTGTSFSAPFVTGVVSLLKRKNSRLTALQIKNILLTSASKNIGLNKVGSGALNLRQALNLTPIEPSRLPARN